MPVETLGVDIGGVLIERVDARLDTSFFVDNYLATPAVADAFDALHSLNVQRFGDRIFLVSKCGLQVQARTREWLEHHRFYDRTGMLRGHVHFSRFDPAIAESNSTRNCGRLLLFPNVPADTGGGH